jgi:hypothetical protein
MTKKLMANKTAAKKRADERVIELDPSAGVDSKLKGVGGSNFDSWNRVLVNQAMRSGWFGHTTDKDMAREQNIAYLEFLRGVRPRDELEGMLAAHLLASHNAAMECYRRAMVPEQTFEGRSEALTQANKLSRTFTTLLEALNRHRGKGQQKVTVEHVHVHAGGQAVVGVVEPPGGGDQTKSEGQPHALTHAPGETLRGENTEREALPVARNEEREMPHARWAVSRCAEGK